MDLKLEWSAWFKIDTPKNILSKIVVNVGNKEKRRLIKKLDKIQIWKKI